MVKWNLACSAGPYKLLVHGTSILGCYADLNYLGFPLLSDRFVRSITPYAVLQTHVSFFEGTGMHFCPGGLIACAEMTQRAINSVPTKTNFSPELISAISVVFSIAWWLWKKCSCCFFYFSSAFYTFCSVCLTHNIWGSTSEWQRTPSGRRTQAPAMCFSSVEQWTSTTCS